MEVCTKKNIIIAASIGTTVVLLGWAYNTYVMEKKNGLSSVPPQKDESKEDQAIDK